MDDPFLDRLTWICTRVGAELDPPAGPRDARTLTAVRAITGQGTPRALELWFEGTYPTGARTLDSLERLERSARERWPDYPDGTLAEVAREAWARRRAAAEPSAPVTTSTPPPAPRRRRPLALVAAAAAGGLTLVAGLAAYAGTTVVPDDEPAEPAHVAFTFDDLGGGSPNIRVYAGPGDTDADRVITGRYPTGDEVTVSCVASGRPVASDPSVGEEDRSSAQWVRIDWSGEEEQWATVVYGDVDLAALADCEG